MKQGTESYNLNKYPSRCEIELTSNKYLKLSEHEYRCSTAKYTDSLGCLRTSNNIIFEASR